MRVFLSPHKGARNQKHKVAQERGLIEKRKEPTSFRVEMPLGFRMSERTSTLPDARTQRQRGLNKRWIKRHTENVSRQGLTGFSGGLEDGSASFRLKSEWTKSAPGPGSFSFSFWPTSQPDLFSRSIRVDFVFSEFKWTCVPGTHKLLSGMSERTGLGFSRHSTRLLEVIPLSGIPLLQNSGLVGSHQSTHVWIYLNVGPTIGIFFMFIFPIGSSRVFFSARALSDVAASHKCRLLRQRLQFSTPSRVIVTSDLVGCRRRWSRSPVAGMLTSPRRRLVESEHCARRCVQCHHKS